MTDTEKLAAKAGTVRIGDQTVHRLGLGTNRITDIPAAHELLKQAVAWGVNFVDTAHIYQSGASEITIGRTLAPYPEDLVVATKGGMNGASPEQLRAELEESLERLQTGCIDLYQLHRVDPVVPLETSVQALKDFLDEGKICNIGLSEVTVEQIETARAIAPIASVQNEYNLAVREHESVVDYCTEHGIVFIPWFPLGGLRGDTAKVNQLADELAQKHQVLPQQIALAWLLERSPMMLPIPGTLSVDHLRDNLLAADIQLSEDEFNQLQAI